MTNVTLNTATRKCTADKYFLGYEGENNINKLIFKFEDGFRDGLGILNVKRGEEKGYLDLQKADDTYELEVKSALLSKIGEITFQLSVNEPDGTVIKYDAFQMVVKDSIDADTEMPEDYPNWVDMANAKLTEVDEAIERAESVSSQLLEDKANGVFNGKDGVDGKDGIDGKNGVDGTNGKDGVSPTVTTQQTSTGATITIKDATGTRTATLLNGKDGKDGADGTMSFEDLTEEQKASLKGDKGDKGDAGVDGKDGSNGTDGFSPIANVTQTSTGAEITITDKNGTSTAVVTNGKDGASGSDGKPGEDGKDGLTPHIGSNGNWWIGETDTGVGASGSSGSNGKGFTYTKLNTDKRLKGDKDSGTPKEYTLTDSVLNYDLLYIEASMEYDDPSSVQYTENRKTSIIIIPETIVMPSTTDYYDYRIETGDSVAGANFDCHIVFGFKSEKVIRIVNNFHGSNVASARNFSIINVFGLKFGGGASSGTSGGVVEKTLFDGSLTVGGANETLTDSILNYDFALVTVCADLEGWGVNSLMQEIVVNTKNITFKGNSGTWDGFYDVYNSNGAGNWYRVCFGFVDETTITLGALTNGGNWKNARIKKVTGYKINGGSSADNYSTDETVVGKWIDGKTLYQKTITGYKAPETTGDGKTASINADLSSLNIESFVYAEAILLDAASVRPIPTFWSSGSYGVQFYYNTTNDSLFIKNTSSNHNNADLIITIKYTKRNG